MAITETETDIATLVGETVAALVPTDDAWALAPTEELHLPDGDVEAVAVQVGDHLVAFVVHAEMARRLQVGPPPAESVADGLRAAAEAVAQVLALGPIGPLTTVDLAALVDGLHTESHAAGLVEGDAVLVTVIVSSTAVGATGPESALFEPITGESRLGSPSGLEVLHGVQMGVTVELGRTRMPLRDILSLVPGAVIELDRPASAPVDVLVNGTLIARGEVVVIDEEFGIRITEVIGAEQSVAAEIAP